MAGHSQELYDVLSPACEKLANGDPWDTTAMVGKKDQLRKSIEKSIKELDTYLPKDWKNDCGLEFVTCEVDGTSEWVLPEDKEGFVEWGMEYASHRTSVIHQVHEAEEPVFLHEVETPVGQHTAMTTTLTTRQTDRHTDAPHRGETGLAQRSTPGVVSSIVDVGRSLW